MLQVTDRAAEILEQERAGRGVPDSFGLRVRQDGSNSTSMLHLEFTEEPVPGDQIGETNGVRLFVAADIADALADHAIDAAEDTGLVIRDQSELST